MAYFAASCDTVDDNTKFAKSLELDYPILSDPDRSVATAYGLVKNNRGYSKRWTYYVGPDGKILFVDKKVSPGSHGADVAAKLRELGVTEAP